MTSSSGNIFRVTGPLWGEFIGHWWIPLTKASDAKLWCFLWFAPWINGSVNNHEAGDLRRHRSHYDVIIMHTSNMTWCWSDHNSLNLYTNCRLDQKWRLRCSHWRPSCPPWPPLSLVSLRGKTISSRYIQQTIKHWLLFEIGLSANQHQNHGLCTIYTPWYLQTQ